MRAIITLLLCAALAAALGGCGPAPAEAGAGGGTPPSAFADGPQPTPRPITTVAFVGDSLTARCDLSLYYPARTAYNFGVDGDTVANVRERMGEVYAAKPSALVLLAGINDLAGLFAQPEAVAGELDALLAEIKTSLPETYILVQSLYPVNINVDIPLSSAVNERVSETNALLRDICDEGGYIYIDVYSALVNADGELAEEYTVDGVHISERGYEVISNTVEGSLAEFA